MEWVISVLRSKMVCMPVKMCHKQRIWADTVQTAQASLKLEICFPVLILCVRQMCVRESIKYAATNLIG